MGGILDRNLLLKVRRPSRYLGHEINAIKKDPAKIEVSIALVFPDLYEVGMSHQGLKILYHILNSHDWLAAERAYSVWVDMEKEMRDRGIIPYTLDSGRPLSDFDIIGFSLQHELSYSNVLTMLDLSGIPFLSSDRDNSFPLVIAGGPACFNPEPVADIFDAILIGDGEEAALEICKTVRDGKRNRIDRKEILHGLRKIQGIYIPSFFKVHYLNEGNIRHVEPLHQDYREVQKALLSDIDQYPFPSDQVVPFTQLIHDRLAIEISRGCSRGCRFCQAGMIYRPVRERSPDSVIKTADRALSATGFEEISLLSLSTGDYTCIAPLIRAIMDMQSGKKTAVSLPSLRIDSLDPSWFEEIKRVRKTGFTMAPEVGNDRLREKINKPVTNMDILNMANEIYNVGWNLIKLYFMIGLPGETEQDRKDIIGLAREVASLAKGKGAKAILNVSISTFVPKAHTPFMWVPQIGLDESWRYINMIREGLKGSRVRVKWNQPELSWLEGVFSRGDRRLTAILVEAWRLGARFDAWDEHFSMDIWKEAFKRQGVDPDLYLYRSRSMDEIFPWDHICSGVSKDYLKREWGNAQDGKITADCRKKCHECGVCDHKYIGHVIHSDYSSLTAIEKRSVDRPEGEIKKYRLTFSKMDPATYLSHLELAQTFIRALRRTDLKMVFSKGYHPMPKVSFASALPVGTESLQETVDIELYESIPVLTFREEINRQLPDGLRVKLIEDISLAIKSTALIESHFLVTVNNQKIDETRIKDFLDSDSFPIIKKTKKGDRKVDARSIVKEITYSSPDTISLTVRHIKGPEIRPMLIIQAIFCLKDRDMEEIKILKTGQIMG